MVRLLAPWWRNEVLITVLAVLLAAQVLSLLVIIARLAPGRRRRPPVAPRPEGLSDTTCTVLVPTLNEGERLGPCLEGLRQQGSPLQEILVVDSHSTDATPALVEAAAHHDGRIRLTTDPPLPSGWVGKVWALQHGLSLARAEWVLGVDADTAATPGMVAGVIAAAREHEYDAVSFAPCFASQSVGEQWLQPSMLASIVYRVGAPSGRAAPDQLMANGQCFLVRRDVLLAHGGYAPAKASFADDVALARHLARSGVRVGFLDGSQVYRVRGYGSLGGVWREWGRSYTLADATTRWRRWADTALVICAQGLPLPMLLLWLGGVFPASQVSRALVLVNAMFVVLRAALLGPLSASYERRSLGFWLSPLSDPLAAVRYLLAMLRPRRIWRGRRY